MAFTWRLSFSQLLSRTWATVTTMPDSGPYPQGLSTRSEVEISEAIQACAEECLKHGQHKTRIKAYAVKLHLAGWTDFDVEQVRIGALQVVARLTGDQSILDDIA
jgi:hypothetical protein